MKRLQAIFAALALTLSTAPLQALERDAINAAGYDGGELPEGQSALAAKIQVLLDRAGISPGVIDGYKGGMTATAIRAFERREGLPVDGALDARVWDALSRHATSPVFASHRIRPDDIARISANLPDDYAELARMDWLGFTSAAEALAERFHMDVDFLAALNPGIAFTEGQTITVAQPAADLSTDVARITVDKQSQRLTAFDDTGAVVASYPVSVGSTQTPSPSGVVEVRAKAVEPGYTYNPDVNFQQGDNAEKLTLPPGPNSPVGLVWIDLSKPTYGIHGTPDPAELFSEASHGCVRMTNWDALELARMVRAGTKVAFLP